ncbi:unnamed protein product [Phyllotreta striolata]|uniref:Protein sleepless n=1 Tax=Phyllotreta striolata TaxID=444603 RepID=A0A9N9XTZ3_PHYSR|nr:unnamed protein product [Phyllotreta striolata]
MTISSLYQLVILISTPAITHNELLNPRIDKSRYLVCYQCSSNSSEITPLCDAGVFKLTNRLEKLTMSFHCPPRWDKYCFTSFVCSNQGHCLTTRGCSGDEDVENNKIKSGCITFGDYNETCFCNTNLCNHSEAINNANANFYTAMYLLYKFLIAYASFYFESDGILTGTEFI